MTDAFIKKKTIGTDVEAPEVGVDIKTTAIGADVTNPDVGADVVTANIETNVGSSMSQEALDAHIADRDNPHNTKASQVGAPTTLEFEDHVENFDNHAANTSNPHSVTAAQVGAADAALLTAHTADTDNPHNVTAQQVGAVGSAELTAHTSDTDNPHNVTAEQVGAIDEAPSDGLLRGRRNGVWTVMESGDIEDHHDCKPVSEDPDFDCSTIINSLFSSEVPHRLRVQGKSYRIDKKIVIPAKTGYSITGGGNSSFLTDSQAQMGPCARFTWYGGEDEPMVQMDGLGTVWDGVALFGRPEVPDVQKPNPNTRAAVGILVRGNDYGAGLGSGKHHFPTLAVNDCLTGVQVGVWDGGTEVLSDPTGATPKPGSKNADQCLFGKLWLSCPTGFRGVTSDSIGHTIQDLRHFFKGGTAIHFHDGGKFAVDRADFALAGTWLKIEGAQSNTSIYRFSNLILDNATTAADGGALTLVDALSAPATAGIKITFDGLIFPTTWEVKQTLIKLRGNQTVTIRDGHQVPTDFVAATGQTVTQGWGSPSVQTDFKPSILLDDCLMANPYTVSPGNFGPNMRVRWRDCRTWFDTFPEDGVNP